MAVDRTPAAYTIAEACAVAGIRRTTLYKEIRSGDLRAVKIGGRTVILVNDLRRWLDGRPPIIPKPRGLVRNCSDGSEAVPPFAKLKNASCASAEPQRRIRRPQSQH
jgi:excisionase family DNA binding protein